MTNVAFRSVDDPSGLVLRDRVSKRQFTLYTSAEPTLRDASTDLFPFPVEEARRFVTDGVRLPELTTINVRDTAGEQVAAPDHGSHERLPRGEYVVELDGHVKTYLRVRAPLDIEAGEEHAKISFSSPVEVTVGARARLRRPPTTVTTTRDLDDVRRAVEAMSSSLQTISPERSFPTLRGHPPRLELGDELVIPAAAEPPETGITLTVPRELSALFAIAPLSFYLGADLAFGDGFHIETNEGFTFDLDDPGVECVLQHVFLLDCITRTHGLYKQKPVEYEELVPELSLDLPGLYDATPAERVEAYLSVPTAVTEPHVPRWPSVAYVEPTADRLETIPFLVDDLALIRTDGVDHYRGDAARRVALSRFVSASADARSASAVFQGHDAFVDVPETDARHRVWVGDGVPINASKFVMAGYEHQVQREPTDRERLRVAVACNDASMATEASAVESRYRSYTDEQIELDLHEQMSTSELSTLLGTDTDFFHFIGHATENGLRCPDGPLDVASVSDVAIDSFLLNACQSYRQGLALVEKGAVGGIVTLSDVGNDVAAETGSRLARLLNGGFTLYNALSVVRQLSVVGGQYRMVGDGRITLNRPINTTACITYVDSMEYGYALRTEMLLDETWRVGTQAKSMFPGCYRIHLPGGEEGPFEATPEQVLEFLETVPGPVWLDGEFHLSTDLTREDFEG